MIIFLNLSTYAIMRPFKIASSSAHKEATILIKLENPSNQLPLLSCKI
jgi:hypothetical protein